METLFQGFNPVFSWLFLLLLTAAALVVSWWSYSYLESISARSRWGLILLRSAALLLLIILLANPYLMHRQTEGHMPALAIYLDNSQSMSIERGDYNGVHSYREIIESFELEVFEQVNLQIFHFDGSVTQADHFDLSLDGSSTSLDAVIRHMTELDERITAALIFSDGIITRGRDPIFRARELSKPLFTVPVGDTTRVRDVAISDLFTNDQGYVDTRQIVEVTVSHEGFAGEAANLILLKDEEEIERETLTFQEDQPSERITFELHFEQEGLHHFEAYVPELEGELTAENNRYPFTVDVVDQQQTVVHLAFALHPDVRSIRSLLAEDRNISLETLTWTGDRFIETGTAETDFDNPDLIVIHGSIPEQLSISPDQFVDLPILYFPTENEDLLQTSSNIGTFDEVRPVSGYLNVQLEAAGQLSHPVLELEIPPLERMPALLIPASEIRFPASASVLFTASFRGEDTGQPLVIVDERDTVRRTTVTARGWYRYFQSNNSTTREFTRELFQNLFSWTMTSPELERLSITPDRNVYREGDEVLFRANLRQESGEPESDAVIEITLLDGDGTSRPFTMSHRTEGRYELALPSLGADSYQFSAVARKSDRVIDRAVGEFTVTPSNIEFVQTRRNDQLLRELAHITGGEFISHRNPEALLDHLEAGGLLNPIEEEHTAFSYFYQHLAWFLLVILILTGEWILRRKYALP